LLGRTNLCRQQKNKQRENKTAFGFHPKPPLALELEKHTTRASMKSLSALLPQRRRTALAAKTRRPASRIGGAGFLSHAYSN
jgi:hypothetical protein